MRSVGESTSVDQYFNHIYLGMDVHKKHINFTVMSKHTVLTQAHVEVEAVPAYILQLKKKYPNRELLAAYEAGFSGFSLCKQLVKLGVKSIVVNAADVPTTDKERTTKSDRTDSMKICKALTAGSLRAIWVPPDELEGDRDLVRYRLCMRKDVTKDKTRIKMFLHKQGLHIPSEFDSAQWTVKFRTWLKEQKMSAPTAQMTFEVMLDNLDAAETAYRKHLRRIYALASSQAYAKNMELLRTIPGVGRLSGITILTELGPIDRFSTADKLASYVGLVPMRSQSGSSDKTMPIQRRAQQELRRILVQCAWAAVRKNNHFNLIYENKRRSRPSQIAIISVARRLLNTIYAVLKKSQPYSEVQASKQ
jgi:transposase